MGGSSPMLHQAIAYNEFSLAERDYLSSERGETLIEYWRRWYADSPIMRSPIEKTPLVWGVGTRIVNNFIVPKRVLQAVRKLAAQYRVTPFVIHLTIFCVALARWSRTEDFTVRILGRRRTSLEPSNTVGLMFCADPIAVHAPERADFETVMRGIMREYDASLALRLPTLHYYPPQAARPGIEPRRRSGQDSGSFQLLSGWNRKREGGRRSGARHDCRSAVAAGYTAHVARPLDPAQRSGFPAPDGLWSQGGCVTALF